MQLVELAPAMPPSPAGAALVPEVDDVVVRMHPVEEALSAKVQHIADSSLQLVSEYVEERVSALSPKPAATKESGDLLQLAEVFEPDAAEAAGSAAIVAAEAAGSTAIVAAEAPGSTAIVAAEAPGHRDVAAVAPPPLQAPSAPKELHAAVTMAELSAAVARRQLRAQAAKKSAAEQSDLAPKVLFPSAFSLSSLQGSAREGSKSLDEVAKFNNNGKENSQIRFDKECFAKMRVVGQFNLGFIIAALRTQVDEKDGDADHGLQLFIVDQHASDEKFRFEALNRESKIDRQPLVSPLTLQLTPAQEQLAWANAEIFNLNGFEMTMDEAKPPGRRLRLKTLPACRGMVFDQRDLLDLLHSLEQAESDKASSSTQDASTASSSAGLLNLAGHRALWSSTAVPRPAKVWQLLACRACRGAIMIGKGLRNGEMEKILRNLSTMEQPYHCPHGRPTMRHLIDATNVCRTLRPSPALQQYLGAEPLASPPAPGAAATSEAPLPITDSEKMDVAAEGEQQEIADGQAKKRGRGRGRGGASKEGTAKARGGAGRGRRGRGRGDESKDTAHLPVD
eukprot:gnl/TRDRNA2_/TRDRNA2_35468_c0_seq1.p1 gnl/TRDRNA2_/TRDRNA2_35468_c0~~gnl/TRDRNA2_/TRDRNA2_35468_c0_seq1.p1  ORF type:complete len:656 (+),score=148.57 gnl/TRDRNA2_/TRDRNA2_35468_c0_seq1:275-1969(+)